MSQAFTRRRFIHVAAVGGASAVGSISRAWGDEARPVPEPVRFGPDLEPIVRLIEETPREKCVAALAGQLRAGLPYRRFLAAAFLAALRKQNSHHSVYLVHSAHQTSLDLPAQETLLPLFWAVDRLCAKAAVEAHEFKLPAALFEDYGAVSPEWRPRLLAASAHWLHGQQSPDSAVFQEARREIQKL